MTPRDHIAAWLGVLALAAAYIGLPVRDLVLALTQRLTGGHRA